MSKSPLQLEKYFCTEATLKANPNFKPEDFKDGKIDFTGKSNVKVGTSKNNPHEFQVILNIKIEPVDERPLPYDATLELVGFFNVDTTLAADAAVDLARVTGASILYSAAREFLLTLMSRGPWEPLMLPTISFTELAQKKREKKELAGKA